MGQSHGNLRKKVALEGEASLEKIVKFRDRIKNEARSALQLIIDLSDVYKLPSISGAIIGDLIVSLMAHCRQIAIINANALGQLFMSRHEESPRLSYAQSEKQANAFFDESSMKVLAVEDDDVTAKLIEKYLTQRNLSVSRAATAEEGIQMAQDQRPDLILMDIHLPEMSGIEAAKHIRKNPLMNAIPIIILTADSGKNTVIEAKRLDVEGYVLKPFNPETFFHKILEALSDE